MNILRRQAILICLFLLLFIGGLAADSTTLLTSEDITAYAIQSYEFEVSGKTTQFALRSAIIPADGDPVWKSEDAFLKALNAKRQTLVNKQLFLNVEYEYSFTSFSEGIAYYTVTFFIEDSNTFLALPYPKFDNDETGFLFGVKAKDTNLFGTFGLLNLTAYTSQNDGTLENWDNREDHLEFDITGVAIGETNLSLNFLYERQKTSKPDGKIEYDINWTGIRLMETKLAFSFDGAIDSSAPTQQFDYDISWTGLKLFGTRLNLKTWAEYDPSTGFEQMNPNKHGFSWTYGPFKQNEGRYTLSNLLEWNTKLTNLKTETNLIQHDLKLFTRPLSFKITFLTNKKVSDENLNDATLSTTLGTNFKIPFIGWRWSTSFTPGVEYLYGEESLAHYLEYTNTISNGGRVNYLSSKDKYREGFIFNFKHVYRDYQSENLSYWYVESNITWFPFVVWRFNPHLRFNGFYSGLNPTKYYFLPSGNKNVSEYYRGYLSRSSAITFEDGLIPYGGVLNLNLMMEFIDFGFAKSYANPFLDIGMFGNPDAEDGYSLLATIGMEGWGVLDRFPSHPMRVSLGFNFFDVMDAMKGAIDPLDVEWELSVSFELYF